MTERERLIALLNEGGKIAGEKVHKSIYDYVKRHHHFSSKDDADKIPVRQERKRLIELIHKAGDAAQNAPVIDFTATLADYLLDNGVIVPPVKVGDTVWHYDYAFHVKVIEVYDDGMVFRCGNDGTDDYMAFCDTDIGETVFLTEAEAQQAQKEREAR